MKQLCKQPFTVMKKRKDFVRLSHVAEKVVSKSFVMQYAARKDSTLCIGFTASKKVGNAVQRNKAKRRMRALVAEFIRLNPSIAFPVGYDIVMIARYSMGSREFSKIQKDFEGALMHLKG